MKIKIETNHKKNCWGCERKSKASLEFVTGFLRPSSSKGHLGD